MQVPSGEVSEVCGQLKETLVTASSSSSQAKRGDNKTKAAFTLQQDIGTMLYDGESSYLYLYSWLQSRDVWQVIAIAVLLHFLLHIILLWPAEHVLVSWCGEPVVYLLLSRGCLRYIEVNKLTEIEFHPEDASRASPAPSSHCTTPATQMSPLHFI